MANIERRRKKRKLNLILAAAAAVLVLGGVVALIIVLSGRNKKPVQADNDPTASPTQIVDPETSLDTPDPEPSETEVSSPIPTEVFNPETDDDRDPIRISDEQSIVLVNAECSKQYSASGTLMAVIKGSASIVFVNNTDTIMYEAVFDVGELEIDQVLLNGAPARFSVTEDGILTIPFVRALGADEECGIYLEFDLLTEASEKIEFLRFSYDTSFILSAYIDSSLFIEFSECRAQSEAVGSRIQYTVSDSSVHSVSFGFRY